MGECRNCERFSETAAELGFSVVSQEPLPELCSRRVFVSRWLDGTPLRQCSPEQAKDMVRVGIRAYVTQMLHTGLLHADPHPGNLMLLEDGRLAILDFGSVTSIPPDMRIGMVNLCGHAMHRDWEAVSADVVRMGFLSPRTDTSHLAARLNKFTEAAQKELDQLNRTGAARFGATTPALEQLGCARCRPLAGPCSQTWPSCAAVRGGDAPRCEAAPGP